MRSGFPKRLEREILQDHQRLYGRRSAGVGRFNPVPATPVPILVALVVLLSGIGAGAAPARYEVNFGMAAAIRPPEEAAGVPGVDEMLAFLRRSGKAGEVSVSMEEGEGRPEEIHLLVLDTRLDGIALRRLVTTGFPVLEQGRWEIEELRGTVRGNLAGWLGHALFRVEVNAADVNTARERILAELAARGFPPPARVEVSGEDGTRRIEVDLGEED